MIACAPLHIRDVSVDHAAGEDGHGHRSRAGSCHPPPPPAYSTRLANELRCTGIAEAPSAPDHSIILACKPATAARARGSGGCPAPSYASYDAVLRHRRLHRHRPPSTHSRRFRPRSPSDLPASCLPASGSKLNEQISFAGLARVHSSPKCTAAQLHRQRYTTRTSNHATRCALVVLVRC